MQKRGKMESQYSKRNINKKFIITNFLLMDAKLMMRNREESFAYEEIANYLDKKGIKTKRGGIWKASTVRKILNRELISVE
jgi:hypothetical protein